MFRRKQSENQEPTSAGAGNTRTYAVPGISCDHCKRAIEAQLSLVHGVDSFSVDVEGRTVQVSGGEEADTVAAIEAAGYSVS